MSATNLRQADAKVKVEGVVSELELKEEFDQNLGCNQISGYITVKTSDTNFVRFNVRMNEKTKAKAPNRAYPGMQTVMKEYKSIAKYGEAEADKVRVAGDLNLYHSDQADMDAVGYKSNFFNRVMNQYEPKAEFEVEMFISSIVPEISTDGEETGRALIKGWVPQYDTGIEPLTLVAPTDLADQISSLLEPGQTTRFFGDIINSRVVITREIPVAIGKPRVETKTITKNELVITGCEAAYDDTTTNPPYDAEVVKAAVQARKDRIESRKNQPKANTAGNNRPSAASRGRSVDFSGLGF